MLGIWQLPSYQVTQFILANADLYPDLANAVIEMYLHKRVPETFAGAVEAWKLENASSTTPEFLKPKSRAARLANLAMQKKQMVQNDSKARCTPGTDDNSTGNCPDPILDRYLKPRPDFATFASEPIDVNLDQVEEDRGRRVRNIHGGIWAELNTRLPKNN